jgi:hypothetical protein
MRGLHPDSSMRRIETGMLRFIDKRIASCIRGTRSSDIAGTTDSRLARSHPHRLS